MFYVQNDTTFYEDEYLTMKWNQSNRSISLKLKINYTTVYSKSNYFSNNLLDENNGTLSMQDEVFCSYQNDNKPFYIEYTIYDQGPFYEEELIPYYKIFLEGSGFNINSFVNTKIKRYESMANLVPLKTRDYPIIGDPPIENKIQLPNLNNLQRYIIVLNHPNNLTINLEGGDPISKNNIGEFKVYIDNVERDILDSINLSVDDGNKINFTYKLDYELPLVFKFKYINIENKLIGDYLTIAMSETLIYKFPTSITSITSLSGLTDHLLVLDEDVLLKFTFASDSTLIDNIIKGITVNIEGIDNPETVILEHASIITNKTDNWISFKYRATNLAKHTFKLLLGMPNIDYSNVNYNYTELSKEILVEKIYRFPTVMRNEKMDPHDTVDVTVGNEIKIKSTFYSSWSVGGGIQASLENITSTIDVTDALGHKPSIITHSSDGGEIIYSFKIENDSYHTGIITLKNNNFEKIYSWASHGDLITEDNIYTFPNSVSYNGTGNGYDSGKHLLEDNPSDLVLTFTGGDKLHSNSYLSQVSLIQYKTGNSGAPVTVPSTDVSINSSTNPETITLANIEAKAVTDIYFYVTLKGPDGVTMPEPLPFKVIIDHVQVFTPTLYTRAADWPIDDRDKSFGTTNETIIDDKFSLYTQSFIKNDNLEYQVKTIWRNYDAGTWNQYDFNMHYGNEQMAYSVSQQSAWKWSGGPNNNLTLPIGNELPNDLSWTKGVGTTMSNGFKKRNTLGGTPHYTFWSLAQNFPTQLGLAPNFFEADGTMIIDPNYNMMPIETTVNLLNGGTEVVQGWWIEIKLPTLITPSRFKVATYGANSWQNPGSFTLIASKKNITWYKLYYEPSRQWGSINSKTNFTIPTLPENNQVFQYFRFILHSCRSGFPGVIYNFSIEQSKSALDLTAYPSY